MLLCMCVSSRKQLPFAPWSVHVKVAPHWTLWLTECASPLSHSLFLLLQHICGAFPVVFTRMVDVPIILAWPALHDLVFSTPYHEFIYIIWVILHESSAQIQMGPWCFWWFTSSCFYHILQCTCLFHRVPCSFMYSPLVVMMKEHCNGVYRVFFVSSYWVCLSPHP